MNPLNKLLIGLSYKMLFFWVIPIINAGIAVIQNLYDSQDFILINFVRGLIIAVINPYLIGAIWLIGYSFWKALSKDKNKEIPFGKGNNSSLAANIDLDYLKLGNYMRFVFYAWVVQLPFILSNLM